MSESTTSTTTTESPTTTSTTSTTSTSTTSTTESPTTTSTTSTTESPTTTSTTESPTTTSTTSTTSTTTTSTTSTTTTTLPVEKIDDFVITPSIVNSATNKISWRPTSRVPATFKYTVDETTFIDLIPTTPIGTNGFDQNSTINISGSQFSTTLPDGGTIYLKGTYRTSVNNVLYPAYLDKIFDESVIAGPYINGTGSITWTSLYTLANPPPGPQEPQEPQGTVPERKYKFYIKYGTTEVLENTTVYNIFSGNLNSSIILNRVYDFFVEDIPIGSSTIRQLDISLPKFNNAINYTNYINFSGNTGTYSGNISPFYLFFSNGTTPLSKTITPGTSSYSVVFEQSAGFALTSYSVTCSADVSGNSIPIDGTISLTAETFFNIWSYTNSTIFDDITFSSANFKANYLYYYNDGNGNPDTYYLYVNDKESPFETGPDGISFDPSGNYTWKLSNYADGTFTSGDKIKLKSKNKFNYGYSGAITTIIIPEANSDQQYINYSNKISWTPSASISLIVKINGNTGASGPSPVSMNFDQSNYSINTSYPISLSSDGTNFFDCGSIELTADTFSSTSSSNPNSFWNGGSINIFGTYTFTSNNFKTGYLHYATDTYYLYVHRDNVPDILFEDGVTGPNGISFDASGNYIWSPSSYADGTFKTEDEIKLQSKTKSNYGYSGKITTIIKPIANASNTYINYKNSIYWTTTTGPLYVKVGNTGSTAKYSSPVPTNFIEPDYSINTSYSISLSSDGTNFFNCGNVTLTDETFSSTSSSNPNSFWNGGPINIFDTYTFTSNNFKDNYLYYATDTYYLYVHRGNTDILFEDGPTGPDGISFNASGNYTWKPFSYADGTFEEDDEIKLKSKNKLNYGYSGEITTITKPTATAGTTAGTTCYINYKSTIYLSTTGGTPLYVTINEHTANNTSPIEIDFYQNLYPIYPLDGYSNVTYPIFLSSDTHLFNCGTITFTDETFSSTAVSPDPSNSFWGGGPINIFGTYTFTSNNFKDNYLYYATDTYYLYVHRGNTDILFEDGPTGPTGPNGISFDASGNYTWSPSSYEVGTFQDGDKIKLKSKNYLNYGYSGEIIISTNTSSVVTQSSNIVSENTSTVELGLTGNYTYTFSVTLKNTILGSTASIPVGTATIKNDSKNFTFFPYLIPGITGTTSNEYTFLDRDVTLTFTSDENYSITSNKFTIFSSYFDLSGNSTHSTFISRFDETITFKSNIVIDQDYLDSGETFTINLYNIDPSTTPTTDNFISIKTLNIEDTEIPYSFHPYEITDITGKTGTEYKFLDKDVYLTATSTRLGITSKRGPFSINSHYFDVTVDNTSFTFISNITATITFVDLATDTNYFSSGDKLLLVSPTINVLKVLDLNTLIYIFEPYNSCAYADYPVNKFTVKSEDFLISDISNEFEITKEYLEIIKSNKSEYFTIENISTNLIYSVTTTSNFNEIVTATYKSFNIADDSFRIDLSGNTPDSGKITKTCSFDIYSKLTNELCLIDSNILYFNSKHSGSTIAGEFSLNPNSIESPVTGNFSILAPIEITWNQIKETNYTLEIDDFRLTENDILITSSTNTPYLWEVYTTTVFGAVLVTIRSNRFLIFTSFIVNITNASAADYGLLQNKKLGVAPCSSISLTPALSRATTNTICVPTKKNNVPTTTIRLGNRTFRVPCGVVKYLPELKFLLTKMTLRDALLFLIQKYDIPVPTRPVQNVKRYQYPTSNATIKYPIIQFNTSFRLGQVILGSRILKNPLFVEKRDDARVLEVCNDDTKTFSVLYTDMLQNCTYWLSTLPSFKEGSFTYCIIRPTNADLKKTITGSISLRGNVLVFTPIILRALLFFYQPYIPNTDITIVYSNPDVSAILTYIQETYFQESIVVNSSCL